jgi:uncharacterized membrane protein YgcG
MRVAMWSVLLLLSSMPAAACGGNDLTLPGPGDPAALSIVAGDGQRGPLGEALADPLVVRLVDLDGLPVEGRDVVFRFTDEVPDATVDPESAPTDTAGVAAVRARLGRQEGSQGIEALVAVPGEDLRVRFRLTALPVDDGDDGGPAAPPPDDGNGGNGGGGGGSGGGGGGGHGGGGHGGGGHGGAHGNGHGNKD